MSRHLDNAVLRRYVDEPDALLSHEKAHLLQCPRCRHGLEQIRENAAAAAQGLALDATPPNLGSARAAILARAAGYNEPVVAMDGPVVRSGATSWRWLAAAAAVVALLMFTYAPFRAYAASLLTIFQPAELAPISVSKADMTQMHDMLKLEDVGRVNVVGSKQARHFASLDAVQQFAGEPVLRPSYLPSQLGHASAYEATPPQSVRFTFDAAKARASAARRHETLPPAPAGIDGAVLTMQVKPFVIQSYGTDLSRSRHEENFPRNAIVVMQGRVPVVHSNGVKVEDVESYLLSLPNVPDDVKAQIRAIRNPSETMPIPVGINQTTARSITVHGVPGLLIGDNTGVGSVVMWLQNGVFYSVAGGFTADEITKVANSLTS